VLTVFRKKVNTKNIQRIITTSCHIRHCKSCDKPYKRQRSLCTQQPKSYFKLYYIW